MKSIRELREEERQTMKDLTVPWKSHEEIYKELTEEYKGKYPQKPKNHFPYTAFILGALVSLIVLVILLWIYG